MEVFIEECGKGLVVLAAVVGICAWAVEFVINNVAAGIIALVSSLSLLDVAIIVALITGCVSIAAKIYCLQWRRC